MVPAHGSPRTVLLTGGAGFIGSHLASYFLSRGWRVTVLDDLSTGLRENLPDHPSLTFILGSVMESADLAKAGQVDLVMHLAGIVGMRLAHAHRELAYEVAEAGSRRVMEATGSAPVVLFSSSAVYGLTEKGSVSEDWDIAEEQVVAYDGAPRGYALGKWRMECCAREAAEAQRRVLIVRPFNVVGPRQSSQYGMVLPSFIRRALASEPLEVYGDGNQTRSFSCVFKFVETLFMLLEHPRVWDLPGRVINLGAPEDVKIGDLAKIVLEETQSISPVCHRPYEMIFPGRQDVKHRRPDIQRLESLIGPIEWPDIRSVVKRSLSDLQYAA